MKAISEHSAGGVVFRHQPRATSHEPKWLICKHSGYHKWVLPKGIVEDGEDPKTAAIREVLEETGIKAEIIGKITQDVRYKYMKQGNLIDKRVEFYLMKHVSGDIKDHCWEMEEVKWVTGEEALNLLAFETEKNTLNQAAQML